LTHDDRPIVLSAVLLVGRTVSVFCLFSRLFELLGLPRLLSKRSVGAASSVAFEARPPVELHDKTE